MKESINGPSIHYQLTDGSPASTGRKTAGDLSWKYACNAWSARNIEMSRTGSSAPQVSDVTSFFISEHNSTCSLQACMQEESTDNIRNSRLVHSTRTELNCTNYSVNSRIEIHLLRTNRALTVLVSLQPINTK